MSKPFDEQIGKDFIRELSRLREISEKNIESLQENTKANRMNTYSLMRNTLTIEQTNSLLQHIKDNMIILPSEVMDELIDVFQRSMNSTLQTLGEKMKESSNEKKSQLLHNFLSNSANIATISSALLGAWTNIGPTLLEFLFKIMP